MDITVTSSQGFPFSVISAPLRFYMLDQPKTCQQGLTSAICVGHTATEAHRWPQHWWCVRARMASKFKGIFHWCSTLFPRFIVQVCRMQGHKSNIVFIIMFSCIPPETKNCWFQYLRTSLLYLHKEWELFQGARHVSTVTQNGQTKHCSRSFVFITI